MNQTTKHNVAAGFEDLFVFKNDDEANAHEAQMIVFRFLSEIQLAMDAQGISRKELAQSVKTSASYITQIFRGDKQPNFDLLARMQRALGITFNVAVAEVCPVVNYPAEQAANPTLLIVVHRPAPLRPRPTGSPFADISDVQWPVTSTSRPAYA